MPTNEEGEFELVLGNRQLLSVFFIIVVLLGVFFTMGYIVGRNTLPANTEVASAKGGQAPIVVEPAGPRPTPADSGQSPASGERPSPAGPVVDLPKATSPTETASRPPEPAKPEPAKPAPAEPEPLKPVPAKPEPPKPAPAKAGTPPAGNYLQVAATRQAEADLLAEVLAKKGYPTTTMPVPESSLIRVLVGPLSPDNVPATRSALEAAGFKPLPRRF